MLEDSLKNSAIDIEGEVIVEVVFKRSRTGRGGQSVCCRGKLSESVVANLRKSLVFEPGYWFEVEGHRVPPWEGGEELATGSVANRLMSRDTAALAEFHEQIRKLHREETESLIKREISWVANGETRIRESTRWADECVRKCNAEVVAARKKAAEEIAKIHASVQDAEEWARKQLEQIRDQISTNYSYLRVHSEAAKELSPVVSALANAARGELPDGWISKVAKQVEELEQTKFGKTLGENLHDVADLGKQIVARQFGVEVRKK